MNNKTLSALVVCLLSTAIANADDYDEDCDPAQVGETKDSYTVGNIEEINKVSKKYLAKDINNLCEGLVTFATSKQFDAITGMFIRDSGITKQEFFSETMFNLTCPANGEHFLHHVLKRNPIDFERLINREDVSYPTDIPREYKRGKCLTLGALLNEFKEHYYSNGWGGRFVRFRSYIRKLGK